MAGYVEVVIEKRKFDFAQLGNSGIAVVVLRAAIDAATAREGNLVVRVHERNISAGSSAKMEVIAIAECPSPDEPNKDFLEHLTTTGTGRGAVTIDVAGPLPGTVPGLGIANLTGPFGSALRVILRATQAASAAATFDATISVVLALKS